MAYLFDHDPLALGPFRALLFFRFVLFLTRDVRGAGTEAPLRDGEFGDVGRRGVGDGTRGLKQPHQPLNLGLTTLQHFQQDLRRREEVIVFSTILFDHENVRIFPDEPSDGSDAFVFEKLSSLAVHRFDLVQDENPQSYIS